MSDIFANVFTEKYSGPLTPIEQRKVWIGTIKHIPRIDEEVILYKELPAQRVTKIVHHIGSNVVDIFIPPDFHGEFKKKANWFV